MHERLEADPIPSFGTRMSAARRAIFVVAFSVIGANADAAGLFVHHGAPATVGSHELQAHHIRVSTGVLRDAENVMLDLGLGLQLHARRTGGELRTATRFDWIGVIDAYVDSAVVIVVDDEHLVANVRFDGRLFQVRQTVDLGDDVHRVAEVDPAAFDAMEGADEVVPNDSLFVAPPANLDDGSQIDVLVVYTQAAAAASPNIGAEIQLAFTETNQSYVNSGVNHHLTLVHTAAVTYTESGDMATDLGRLQSNGDGFMDQVHTLRETYCADVVALIIETGGGCGIAYKMDTVSVGFASFAFSVTKRSCATGNYSFGHEIGHNLGCNHDRYVSAGDLPYAYAYGYVNSPARWRTVMAYNDECANMGFNCARLAYWSNPDVILMGAPMGVPEGSQAAADNRKTLNNTALTASQFRDSQMCAVQADLVLTKTLTSPATATVGDTVSFAIRIENQGPGTLSTGTLGDTIPTCLGSLGVEGARCPTAGVPSVTCSGAGCGPASCTITNGGRGFVFGSYWLAASDGFAFGDDELTVSVNVSAGATPGLCTNLAGTTDPTDGVITDTASVTILGTVDLDLTMNRTSPNLVAPNGTASFDILVENTGGLGLSMLPPLGDTISPCFQPLGTAGNACPTGPGAPSVRCSGNGCANMSCTVSNNGHGFLVSGLSLAASDGVAGGDDQVTVTLDVRAGGMVTTCQNLAAISDPADGLISAIAGVDIRLPWAMELYWSNSVTGDSAVWELSELYPIVSVGYYLPRVGDVGWHAATVADLDAGDLTRQLIWRHSTTGENVAWNLQGRAMVGAWYLNGINDPAATIGGGLDMNSDGNQDLVWRNQATGDNAVWYMSGPNVIGSSLLPQLSDTAWRLVGGADFNGDGRNDLVWWHATTGSVAVWYMNGPVLQGGALIAQVSDVSWQLVGVVDADDDGDGDLIWRNSQLGANAVWTMSGIDLKWATYLTSTQSDWYLVGAR